jgi:hypothetical protein
MSHSVRTVADLTTQHESACLGLLALPGVTIAAAREHLAACGALPDKRRALARLDELARRADTVHSAASAADGGAASPLSPR